MSDSVVQENLKKLDNELHQAMGKTAGVMKGEFGTLFEVSLPVWISGETGEIVKMGSGSTPDGSNIVSLRFEAYAHLHGGSPENAVFAVSDLQERAENKMSDQAVEVMKETEEAFNRAEN